MSVPSLRQGHSQVPFPRSPTATLGRRSTAAGTGGGLSGAERVLVAIAVQPLEHEPVDLRRALAVDEVPGSLDDLEAVLGIEIDVLALGELARRVLVAEDGEGRYVDP